MEPKEKTQLIRLFEKYCKKYILSTQKIGHLIFEDVREIGVSEGEYFTIRDICLDFGVLTEEQIMEHENHMREQYL